MRYRAFHSNVIITLIVTIACSSCGERNTGGKNGKKPNSLVTSTPKTPSGNSTATKVGQNSEVLTGNELMLQNAVTLLQPAAFVSDVRVALNNNGNGFIIWQEVANTPDKNRLIKVVSVTSGKAVGTSVTLSHGDSYGAYPGIAIDDMGNAIAIWLEAPLAAENLSNSVLFANAFVKGSGWQTATPIAGTDLANYSPMGVALDGQGNGAVLWKQPTPAGISPVGNTLMLAAFDKTSGWHTPELVGAVRSDDYQSCHPAIAANGSKAWACETYDSIIDPHNMVVRVYTASGGWSNPTTLASQSKTMSPYLAFDENDKLNAIWNYGQGMSASQLQPNNVWGAIQSVAAKGTGDGLWPSVTMDGVGGIRAEWLLWANVSQGPLAADKLERTVWTARFDIGKAQWDEPVAISPVLDDASLTGFAQSPNGQMVATWKSHDVAWLNQYVGANGWQGARSLKSAVSTGVAFGSPFVNSDGTFGIVFENSSYDPSLYEGSLP